MNRPGISQLPTRRQTVTDLRKVRESKGSILFKTRILPIPRLVVPTISSKTLKKKIIDLYPELEEKMKEQERLEKKNEVQRENQINPQQQMNRLRMTQGFSSSFNIKHKRKDNMFSLSPVRPLHKSTRVLMSTINVKNYAPLFQDS